MKYMVERPFINSSLPINITELPVILEINLVMMMVFLALTIILISLILYLRVHKNAQNRRRQKLRHILIDFINNYLFDEDFEKDKELLNFKHKHLRSRLDKQIAIDQILEFAENLKGESESSLKEIFQGFGLKDFLLLKLKNKAWFKQAKALNVAYLLNIELPIALVNSLFNTPHKELRQQAFLYYLHLSTDNPLGFLDKVKVPLTLWEQIYIENGLKSYEGHPPDFSKWLYHDESSVVIFCMKMIADYNQFEHIPLLLKFLHHQDPEIRQQAIISLRKVEEPELMPIITHNFKEETLPIKQEILKTIGLVGSKENLLDIPLDTLDNHPSLEVAYKKVAHRFNLDLSHTCSVESNNLKYDNPSS